jgi:PIN domain nuclease of toxin-antitoxin system
VAAVIYLDTHVAAWLYAGLTARFSPAARDMINDNDLYLSPMVILELQYLYETGWTATPGKDVVEALTQSVGLKVCDDRFPSIMAQAAEQTWTRDPFDRIIVGHAALRQQILVTKDRHIRTHYPHVFWSSSA